MCSITALLNRQDSGAPDRQKVLEASLCQRHRGPDWSGIREHDGAIIAHERLAIVDVLSGAQPMVDIDKGSILAVNGEIYNHCPSAIPKKQKAMHFNPAAIAKSSWPSTEIWEVIW